MKPDATDALIVVDMQNDFIPGGALPVKDGDLIVSVINHLLPFFNTRVFTRDWHPPNHISFSQQPAFSDRSWPPHCVQNTWGANFHPGLRSDLADIIIHKGTDPKKEAYSGFQDTELTEWLKQRNIKRVFIAGLATDYCVKATARDALQAGFETYIILDGIQAVDIPAGAGQAALRELSAAGVASIKSEEFSTHAEP